MKPVIKLLALAGAVTLVFACCSQNHKEMRSTEESPAAATESKPSDITSSSAAVENNKDTSRKFIRTADIKFKVKSVVNTTYAIEDIVADQGGFVTYTQLNSTIDNHNSIPVSADSSLETTYYTVVNNIKLRVPNTKLDTTLKSIAKLIDYLDYRTIRADDVAIQMLGNKLKQQRLTKHEQRLTNAIDNRGKKLEQVSDAEENLLSKQEQADDARLSNLSTQDYINFSTVTLEIYQRQEVKRELTANYKNIDAYQASLGTRLREAFLSGLQAVEGLVIFMVEIWWLLLLLVVLVLVYKRYGRHITK